LKAGFYGYSTEFASIFWPANSLERLQNMTLDFSHSHHISK